MNNSDIFIIHPFLKTSQYKQTYHLDEAKNLVKAIELKCKKSFMIGLEKISPKTFINKSPELKEVIRLIEIGHFSNGDKELFKPLLNS